MATKARMFGSIAKVEDLDDGTVMVEGVANAPTPDSDGETFTSECMKAAIPDYMKNRRALREMHQPIAAGVTKALWVDEEGVTRIRAHVVDPVSVKKVQTGVLKMFSIEGVIPPGGRDPLDRKIVHKLKLREVSLVDVGAHPDAMIEVVKLDKPQTEEAPMATEKEPTAKAEGQGEAETLDAIAKAASDAMAACAAACARCIEECIACAKCCMDCMPMPGPHQYWCAECISMCVACARCCVACAEACSDPTMKADIMKMAAEALAVGEDLAQKVGAKYSKSTKEAIKAMKMKMGEMAEAMKAFGDADLEDDEAGEEGEEGKTKKLAGATAEGEDLVAKAAGLTDTVAKLEGEKADLVAKLDTVTSEKEALAAELDKAEKGLASVVEQMKAKGMLKTVDKAADSPSTAKKSSTPSGGEAEPSSDPLDQIRKIQATGGVKINPSAR